MFVSYLQKYILYPTRTIITRFVIFSGYVVFDFSVYVHCTSKLFVMEKTYLRGTVIIY